MKVTTWKDRPEVMEKIETILKDKNIIFEKLESLSFKGGITYDLISSDMSSDMSLVFDCMAAGASTFSVN